MSATHGCSSQTAPRRMASVRPKNRPSGRCLTDRDANQRQVPNPLRQPFLWREDLPLAASCPRRRAPYRGWSGLDSIDVELNRDYFALARRRIPSEWRPSERHAAPELHKEQLDMEGIG
jgi:hypothetical protein